jgi:hypothetical protein
MLTTLMGAGVFSIGFFMLILGLMDLLQLGGLRYGLGERLLLYIGGIFLCVLGYVMARRLPRRVAVSNTNFPQSDLPAETLPPTDDSV